MDSPSSTEDAAKACAAGCGFFGTAANNDYCSKCLVAKLLKEVLQQIFDVYGVPSDQPEPVPGSCPAESVARPWADVGRENTTSDQPESESVVKKKKRCGSCSKNIGMLGFKCKCGDTFCGAHRFPEEHACGYDFREAGRVLIMKENPICKSDKLEHRI